VFVRLNAEENYTYKNAKIKELYVKKTVVAMNNRGVPSYGYN